VSFSEESSGADRLRDVEATETDSAFSVVVLVSISALALVMDKLVVAFSRDFELDIRDGARCGCG
jgi:hypothetical protein